MKDYEQIIRDMPAGVDRTVLRILSFHRGELRLIERTDLLIEVQSQSGMENVDDRQMRDAIHELRNLGVRVCHNERRATKPNGKIEIIFGYYLASSEAEYNEFRLKYGSYARTIWQTIKAMDARHAVVNDDGELEPPKEIAVQQSFL